MKIKIAAVIIATAVLAGGGTALAMSLGGGHRVPVAVATHPAASASPPVTAPFSACFVALVAADQAKTMMSAIPAGSEAETFSAAGTLLAAAASKVKANGGPPLHTQAGRLTAELDEAAMAADGLALQYDLNDPAAFKVQSKALVSALRAISSECG